MSYVIYPSSFIKWPDQWIGLREILQESPMIFMGKSMVSGFNFPVKTNPGWPENLASLCWKNSWMVQVFIAYAADIGWIGSSEPSIPQMPRGLWIGPVFGNIMKYYIYIIIYYIILYYCIYIYNISYITIYIHYSTILLYIYTYTILLYIYTHYITNIYIYS